MNRNATQLIKLIVVIIALAIVVFFDPLATAKGVCIEVKAQVEEKATEEALEPANSQEPKVTSDEAGINGTNPVESVLVKKVKEMADNVEEWYDMYICVDVATIYKSPDGEKLEEVYFSNKVQMSSKECKTGWREIRLEDGKVGYIKAENLMTANQMLDNFRYLLAQILYAEAGGVSKWEMRLVGEVVFNRLTTDYWEFEPYCTTLWGVLSQSGQYPETLRKIRNGITPSEDALEVAKALLLDEYEELLPDDCL